MSGTKENDNQGDANRDQLADAQVVDNPNSEVDDEEKKHPIEDAIDTALHRYRDIEAVSRLLVPAAAKLQKDIFQSANDVFETARKQIDEGGEEDCGDGNLAANLDDAMLVIDRVAEANLPRTLNVSLFLGLFSAFDAFTGNLLSAIYLRRPDLLESLNAEVPLSEILRFDTFDDLKKAVLADEIDAFRRKSYVEQFELLEKRFGLPLRSLESWSEFVEIGQRRNLITHCEGVVSKQYLQVCAKHGTEIQQDLMEGDQLSVSLGYLLRSCSVLYEVTLKLGQTLWRKVFPNEHHIANSHLIDPVYQSLQIERWDRAILISEFAGTVEGKANERDRRIRVINSAIAYRFSGNERRCEDVLSAEDWSAASKDFNLAVEVLRGNFEDAACLMTEIGKKGDLVTKSAYHTWPLFREFRRSGQFLTVYEKVFGSTFTAGMVQEAAEAEGGDTDPEMDESAESDSEVKVTQDSLEPKDLRMKLRDMDVVKALIG
ncbi:hypothetical protein [Stratiformator vulcanicus]|uniref:Uncharacterized protein n=1 Tax=Stratiformator vulcanicus TaxID=2527980 RepID=A0A517QYD0_9PLAN|nr:hypothetical protein [Stratiformator vulcanicus]QDT36560.1 hypothetical protein Pan189_09200 [Stratiformator vulcanicus]